MSDTWKEIQSVRSKTAGLRDRLAKRKQERQNILDASKNLVVTTSTTSSESGHPNVSSNDDITTVTQDDTPKKGVTLELKDTSDVQTKNEDSDQKLSVDDMVSSHAFTRRIILSLLSVNC